MVDATSRLQRDAPAPGAPSREISRRRRRAAWIVPALLALAGAGALLGRAYLQPPDVSPAPAAPAVAPRVVGLGRLEPNSAIVTIGAPGDTQGSKVSALLVDEGQTVTAGQALARLDSLPKLAAQLQSAKAATAVKRIALDRQSLETAYQKIARTAALDKATADLENAEAEYRRQQTLVEKSAAAQSVLEKRKADYAIAQATVRDAAAALARIDAQVDGEPVDVAAARADLAAAEADERTAEAALAQATLRAPFAGTVLSVKTHAGERIGSDGLVELGAVDQMRAIVEVYETDVARVRIGQSVELKVDALATPLQGAVERIGRMVKRQTVVNNDPATATDSRVVEVTVSLDAEESRRAASLSRAQVRATYLP